MKNVKKIVGLLLVMVLALSMAIPAFAETTGTITIENPQSGEDYKAYKVFDVIYDTEKKNYAYTIADDSPWLAGVLAYAADAGNGLVVTDVETDDLYTVTFGADFRAADFAAKLEVPADATAIDFADVDGKMVAEVSEPGYYFVTTGALCLLTTADPSATIYDKNETPTITKESDDEDGLVEVGQTITYTITGTVPSTTGYSTYTYKVADTLGTGLKLNEDVAVKFGDTAITDVAAVYDANGFTLTYDMVGYQDYVGQTITITYTAVVTAEATGVNELTNKAVLTYSTDPNADDTDPKTAEDVVDTVYTCNIEINKYDAADADKKLDGAKFKLYKEEEGAKKYYKWNETTGDVEWVASQADGTEVETDKGYAVLNGLGDGTYYLEETEAPKGYNRLAQAKTVVIGADAKTTDGIVTVDVENSAGVLLPSTGGIGTTIFYVVGIALIAAAFILLVTKKRMSTEK